MQLNLLDIFETPVDYSHSKVLVPLSGGINSAAVLCVLGDHHPDHLKPQALHLYYSHLKEHSPDTFSFVADLIRYARKKFKAVQVTVTRASVNKYFIEQRMIPHPTLSPCSRDLKFGPMQAYDRAHAIDYVLIGFVKHEYGRYLRAQEKAKKAGRTKDVYPSLNLTDDDCFEIVKQAIGWYPAIYDLRWSTADAALGLCSPRSIGKRVFTHNNCFPCKNMSSVQIGAVGRYLPQHAARAQATAAQIPGAYWGRDDVPDVFKCDVCERF